MVRHSYTTLSVLITTLALCAAAQAEDEANPGNRYVSVRLISDSEKLVAGNTSYIAAQFEIVKGWHLYWRNPGDSGLPPQVKFDSPPEVKIGEPMWPVPKRIVESGLVSYAYERELVLVFPITLKAGASVKEVNLNATVDWLVCKEKCLTGKAKAQIKLPVSGESRPSSSSEVIVKAISEVPKPGPAKLPYTASWADTELTIRATGASKLTFFPYNNNEDIYPEWSDEQVKAKDVVHLKYSKQVKELSEVMGVLLITSQGRQTNIQVSIPVRK